MSTAEEEVRLSMRVMINKEKTKVLFALVDNSLADILLCFLTLPLGVIPRLLKKHYGDDAPNIGSLNTLYNGLENLDSSHFRTEAGKLMLLNPKSSLDVDCSELKININDTQPVKYFGCGDLGCKHGGVIMYHDTERCPCGNSMNGEVCIGIEGPYEDGEVLTVKTSYFLISDDLRVLPNVTGSFLQSIKDLGITDTDGAKEITITIGFNQIMDLLKGSLLSQTPLSDLILQQRPMLHSPIPKSEPFTLMLQMGEEATSRSKKMKVKATVQKSTQKLVFVQAEEDFIDFLFSSLIIPLGQAENLLGCNTSLRGIDNIYKSLANLNANKYLKTPDTKGWLLDPEIPPNYLSKNQIFPISEQIYNFKGGGCKGKPLAFVYPNNEGSYVKGPGMFMVNDDLTVTPLCMLSTISILNELKIPLCDVEELEIDIGLEEGLRILKASLTSTYALTNGLIHILRKQLNQEH
ncbi:hypothetical protein ACJIZ3_019240 [Penstemon smallii]|uniref:DUF674 family protein n=1 Tax=Penstemon smallii TaxID=265156 RepID=A0ABD3T180_9LAMI